MAEPTESSRLLSGNNGPQVDPSNVGTDEAVIESATTPRLARDHFKRFIGIATHIILVTSFVDLVIIIVTVILLANGPFVDYKYYLRETLLALGGSVRPLSSPSRFPGS